MKEKINKILDEFTMKFWFIQKVWWPIIMDKWTPQELIEWMYKHLTEETTTKDVLLYEQWLIEGERRAKEQEEHSTGDRLTPNEKEEFDNSELMNRWLKALEGTKE